MFATLASSRTFMKETNMATHEFVSYGARTTRELAERAARDAAERAELRRLELAEQRSADNPPDVRIRMWEKLHALRLPRDPEHPIIYVIATDTGLTLSQVREEQRTRFP